MKSLLQNLAALLCLSLSLLLPSRAAARDSGFVDVAADAWYADAVAYVRDRGLMGGVSGRAFAPDGDASRATLVTALHRAAGSPEAQPGDFTDLPAGAWYADAAGWAAERGLVGGYGDGRFGPGDPVTREQMAVVLWRYAGSPGAAGAPDFADRHELSDYAAEAVAWAYGSGILTGRDGNRFAPRESCTRAELAAVLRRYLSPDESAALTLRITVGDRTFAAALEDSPSVRALLARLPLTADMRELNGNEKYFYLPDALPADPVRPGSIRAGDLMLYGSDCLVLFYEDFESSYRYTRLGRIDDTAGLVAALGEGDVTVRFEAE